MKNPKFSSHGSAKPLGTMKRKTVLRLSMAAVASVIIWILWFIISYDADGMTMTNQGQRLPEEFFPSNKKAVKVNDDEIDLPEDLDSLVVPTLAMKQGVDEKAEKENDDYRADATTGLTFKDRVFFLNNKPFRIFSGAIHYFRIVPEYWLDRMKKLKACGLNTVETYVPWNLHEPTPGQFNFEGRLNLIKFINTAAQLGLYVILRPGPFICSEFDFGGLPGWLLRDPDMKVRSNYPGYVHAVNRYFSVLLPMVHDSQFTEGGPIIMFQVENEYIEYGRDITHLKLLTFLLKSHDIKELLVTSDHKLSVKYRKSMDFSEYALPTDNFASMESSSFETIMGLNPHFPIMAMEFWTGWFDYWGSKRHSHRPVREVNKTLNFILNEGGSFNLYMFIGGTSFGFTSGATNSTGPGYQPFVTSYDYDALLTEAGDITPKYTAVRDTMLNFYKSIGIKSLPKVPPNTPKDNYGEIEIEEIMEWDVFISLVPIGTTDNKVNYMETYQDSNELYNTLGYIVYSYYIGDDTHWNKLPGIQLTGYIRDRISAVLNSEIFYVTDHMKHDEDSQFMPYNWDLKWQEQVKKLRTAGKEFSKRLDLMVENQGRVGFSSRNQDLFDQQRKGLQGPVFRYIFGPMEDWKIRFLTFEFEQCRIFSKSSTWTKMKDVRKRLAEREEKMKVAPSLNRAFLNITGEPKDTFIKLDGWTKGVVIVNGFNLGRYWHIGPQRTLYVPAPILKEGRNEILVFEELVRGERIKFQSTPILG